jgi:mono/diheme cytochrome c family protein
MKGGLTRTCCVLCLTVILGCGGDRRSGAVNTADSGQTSAADHTAAGMNDSTPGTTPDTARAVPGPDSASTRQDSASTAAQPKPLSKPASKPRVARPAASAKAAAPTKPFDSSRMSAVPESTGATPPESTTAAAPIQTSDASTPLRDEYHTAPLDTVSQEVYQGWKQFNLNCARCHGEDVQGTTIAPHLIVSLRPEGPIHTKELFVQTVCAGRPAKGMPAWCALGMDMEKINQIYAYVKGRSDSKIHPGRPAVRSGG